MVALSLYLVGTKKVTSTEAKKAVTTDTKLEAGAVAAVATKPMARKAAYAGLYSSLFSAMKSTQKAEEPGTRRK